MARDYCYEFKNKCLTCENYDIYHKEDSTQRGFRCKHYQRPMAMDESCRGEYSCDRLRSNSTIDEAVSWRLHRGYDPKPDSSYWYIMSTISIIKEMPMMNRYTICFNNARDYLEQSFEGRNILYNYDLCGSLVATEMMKYYNNLYTRDKLIHFIEKYIEPVYILPSCELVEKNRINEAVKLYTQMMKLLCKKFNVSYVNIDLNIVKDFTRTIENRCRVRA